MGSNRIQVTVIPSVVERDGKFRVQRGDRIDSETVDAGLVSVIDPSRPGGEHVRLQSRGSGDVTDRYYYISRGGREGTLRNSYVPRYQNRGVAGLKAYLRTN